MGKTVKVRIAVAVDEHGRWCAAGSSEFDGGDSDAMALAVDGTTAHTAWREAWVTATLAVPEPVEVEGVVEEADDA